MDRTTLVLRSPPSVALEAPAIRPDALRGLSEREISRLEVWHGKEAVPLGEFFDVRGGGAAEVRVIGDARRVKHLGAGMESGRLVVEGDAGMHTGAGMRGGHLLVEGLVDAWAGAEMRGGVLEVGGDAGDHLAGAYAGSSRGMTGGVVLVHGSAGARAAERMRRGLVAVRRDTGEYPGAHIIAGSLFVFGRLGPRPGLGMKRGTILAGRAEILPTFRYACTYRPDFVPLYLRHLGDRHGFAVEERFRSEPYRRYSGDFTESGKGEILTCGA